MFKKNKKNIKGFLFMWVKGGRHAPPRGVGEWRDTLEKDTN